jgi:hypothetical protein
LASGQPSVVLSGFIFVRLRHCISFALPYVFVIKIVVVVGCGGGGGSGSCSFLLCSDPLWQRTLVLASNLCPAPLCNRPNETVLSPCLVYLAQPSPIQEEQTAGPQRHNTIIDDV